MKKQFFGLAFTTLILNACNNNSGSASADNNNNSSASADSSKTALNNNGSNTMSNDSTFLATAFMIGNFEIQIGNLAAKNSQNSSVKMLASMMVKDHDAMGRDVSALAQKKGITLPMEISSDLKEHWNKLNGLSGKDFDKEYAEVNVKGHTDAIAMFEKVATDDHSAEVKQLANDALPKLRHHKEESEKLQQKLNGSNARSI